MTKQLSLATCNPSELVELQRRLHPATKRDTLIFAAGALNNRKLHDKLGSAERSIFYDGMLSVGLIEENPYWPDYSRR